VSLRPYNLGIARTDRATEQQENPMNDPTGMRVENNEGESGTVTDTGCGGEVVWVTFDSGRTQQFEQVDVGEFVDVDTDETVRVTGAGCR
jgi:hypothetical protein